MKDGKRLRRAYMETGRYSKLGTTHKMYLQTVRFEMKVLSVLLGLHLVWLNLLTKE